MDFFVRLAVFVVACSFIAVFRPVFVFLMG